MQNVVIGKLNKIDYSAEAAYKSLITKLQLCGSDVKTVTITSCNEGEGKTNVAINLSRMLAESGKNVLFVDADMRNSVLVSRYKISKASNGLSQFLSGQKELDEVLCTTNIDGLFMMIAGMQPADSSRLLKTPVFKNFIQAAREKFDYVIVDTPADSEYTDARIVASVCDGTCFVVSPKNVYRKKLVETKEQYEENGCEILGVIMNKVKANSKGN